MKIIGLCSLYEPLKFLSNRIANLNQCDLTETTIYFADCSKEETWQQVKQIIEKESKFQYKLHHFPQRTTLYYTWNWIIDQTINTLNPTYYHNVNVDDIQAPTYHKQMSTYLDNNPQAQIVACPWYITSIKGQIWEPKHENQSGPDVNTTMGHFPMWRASIHKDGITFDPRMVAIGDSYFWGWVKKKYGNQSLAILPEVLSCYLAHENNLYYSARGPQGQNGEAYDRSIGK